MSFILEQLSLDLQCRYLKWLKSCADENLNVRGIQGWRDPAYQDQLYAQGKSPLTGVTSLHCCTDNGKPSSHAFDFGVFENNGSYVTDGLDPRYILAGQIAESIGLKWGGRFNHPDWDHMQLA